MRLMPHPVWMARAGRAATLQADRGRSKASVRLSLHTPVVRTTPLTSMAAHRGRVFGLERTVQYTAACTRVCSHTPQVATKRYSLTDVPLLTGLVSPNVAAEPPIQPYHQQRALRMSGILVLQASKAGTCGRPALRSSRLGRRHSHLDLSAGSKDVELPPAPPTLAPNPTIDLL
jgi:hypothetical protein